MKCCFWDVTRTQATQRPAARDNRRDQMLQPAQGSLRNRAFKLVAEPYLHVLRLKRTEEDTARRGYNMRMYRINQLCQCRLHALGVDTRSNQSLVSSMPVMTATKPRTAMSPTTNKTTRTRSLVNAHHRTTNCVLHIHCRLPNLFWRYCDFECLERQKQREPNCGPAKAQHL